MTHTKIAVIGGSGIYDIEGLQGAEWVSVETPWGAPSDQVLTGTLEGTRMVFLPRHGRGHVQAPGRKLAGVPEQPGSLQPFEPGEDRPRLVSEFVEARDLAKRPRERRRADSGWSIASQFGTAGRRVPARGAASVFGLRGR